MNRNRLSLLAVAVLAFAAACNTPSSGAADAPAGAPKVAFLLSTLQEERYQKDQKYFEQEAKRLGVAAFTLAADNDNAKQLSQVEDALTRGAKVLVIQPTDSAAAAAYVKKAHDKGAKVVAYDRAIASEETDYYVAHDSRNVGKLSAQAAIDAGKRGNFVLLNGQSGHSVATEIARGYMDVLKPYVDKGEVKIAVEKNHDAWSPEQALKTVEDAIAKTGGDIQAILANNSGMARGAVQAIQAGGLADKKIFVAGADADAANVNYVCEGKQSVEVLKDIEPLAKKAAEISALLAQGKPITFASAPSDGKVPVIGVPVHLITPVNAKQLLLDSGFHAQSAVPACAK